MNLKELISKEEIRRLEKAARDKNKGHLYTWAENFENEIIKGMTKHYEGRYKKQMDSAIETFLIATAYTAHFSESTSLTKDKLVEFMEDLYVTINMFNTGEFKLDDYLEHLKKERNNI